MDDHAQVSALLVFAKAPVPGQVKTRLIAALGAEGACGLYEQLLTHTLERLQQWGGSTYLYCSPDDQHPFLQDLSRRFGLELRLQSGADLGERMANALADHPNGAILIGSDCPVLEVEHLAAVAEALLTHDTAILPSEDGGYVLIGQRRPHPAPFLRMLWSHAEVMEDTRQRLHAAGQSLWIGPTLWDLDEPKDLPRLEALKLFGQPGV